MRSSTTFAVIFFPKPSQRKDKLHNLFARITYDTKRVELSLRINIDLAQWDVGRSRLKGSSNEARRINLRSEGYLLQPSMDPSYSRLTSSGICYLTSGM